MHKIDIETYEMDVKLPSGEMTKFPYEMKEMLVGVLLHPALNITGAELYTRMPIANKIQAANGSILLEDEEYNKLLSAVNTIKGFGMNDREMVRRVIEAEEVKVTESGG
jgi:hypothetical protein